MKSIKSPAQESPPRTRLKFGRIFLSVVVAANLSALGIAWHDKSFLAFAIAIIYGPAGNGLLALLALAATPLLWHGADFSMARHLAFSFGVTAAAAVLDYVVIVSMGLHGCYSDFQRD